MLVHVFDLVRKIMDVNEQERLSNNMHTHLNFFRLSKVLIPDRSIIILSPLLSSSDKESEMPHITCLMKIVRKKMFN